MIRLFEEILDITTKDKSIEQQLDTAQKAYQYLLMDEKFRTKSGIPIRFTQRGFNEFFFSVESVLNNDIGKAASKIINRNAHEIDLLLSTVQHLGDIVANMNFDFYQRNQKPERKPDVRGYEYYTCPIVINGKRRKVKLAFEKLFQDKDKEGKYYYHFLESKKRISSLILNKFSIELI